MREQPSLSLRGGIGVREGAQVNWLSHATESQHSLNVLERSLVPRP